MNRNEMTKEQNVDISCIRTQHINATCIRNKKSEYKIYTFN